MLTAPKPEGFTALADVLAVMDADRETLLSAGTEAYPHYRYERTLAAYGIVKNLIASTLSNYELHTAEVATHNLPMYADEIDCSSPTSPCDRCSYDPSTNAYECPLSDRGECGHDKAEELRDLAKVLAKLPKPTGWLASAVCDVPPAGWTCSRTKGHEGPCAASPAVNTIDTAIAERDAAIARVGELEARVAQLIEALEGCVEWMECLSDESRRACSRGYTALSAAKVGGAG